MLRGRDFRVVPPKARLLALGSANVPSGTLAIARLSLRLCLASARSSPLRSWLAPGQGLEPRYSPSKGDVLPLDDPGIINLSLTLKVVLG